jgi:hypothetical protein
VAWTRAWICRCAVVVAALALSVAAAPSAWGSPARNEGHDISHPQCGNDLPSDSGFGIVGINRGRPFSVNPCLTEQYRWAADRPAEAAVYVNTSNPAPSSPYYWPPAGRKDPMMCRDSRSTTDAGCAYNYGWHAAANALRTGKTLGGEVLGHTWWLDVETSNTWNGDGKANTAVLQGMYDYLRSHGVDKVGLYSTGYQWQKITGGYTESSADGYRTAWQFAPRFALHDAPLWIATAGSTDAAKKLCSTSFTGARTQMVQTQKDGFDTNVVCAT